MTQIDRIINNIRKIIHTLYKKRMYKNQYESYLFEFTKEQSRKNEIKVFNSMVEKNRSLIINDEWTRSYYLKEMPDSISYQYILKLINSGIPMNLSYFINPTNKGSYLRMLRTRRAILIGKNEERQKKGFDADPNVEREINEVDSIIDSMINESQKAFLVGVYVSIKGDTQEQLISYCNMFEDYSNQLEFQFYPNTFDQKKSLPTFLPLGKDTINKKINLQTRAVIELFPFLSRNIQDDSGFYLGTSRLNYNALIIIDPFKARNANIMILGTSGSGKSVTSKSLLLKMVMKQVQCLILDPEGEYLAITESCEGEVITFSKQRGLNIFDLDFVNEEAKMNHISVLKNFFKFVIDPENYSDSKLDIILTKFYQKSVLTLKEFINITKKEKAIFYEDLKKLTTGSLSGIFDSTEKIDFSSGVICFDLHELQTDNIKLPAMYIITSIIDNLINRADKKRMIFIDEAHLFLRQEFTRDFYIRLQKTVRKRQAGVVSITQNAEDFREEFGAKTILTQAETVILLKQHTASINFIKNMQIFDLSDKEFDELYSLSPGEAILFREQEHIYIKIEPFEPEWEDFKT